MVVVVVVMGYGSIGRFHVRRLSWRWKGGYDSVVRKCDESIVFVVVSGSNEGLGMLNEWMLWLW